MELKMNNKIVKNVNVKLGFPLRKICKLHFHERAEKKKNRRGTGTQKSKNNLFLKTHNIQKLKSLKMTFYFFLLNPPVTIIKKKYTHRQKSDGHLCPLL